MLVFLIQINSSLLTLTFLRSSVITALIYNVTEYLLHVAVAQFFCVILISHLVLEMKWSVSWLSYWRPLLVVLPVRTAGSVYGNSVTCTYRLKVHYFCVANVNDAGECYSDVLDGFLFCSEWELRVWYSPDRKSFITFLLCGTLMYYFRENVDSELKSTASFGTWRVRHFLNICCSDFKWTEYRICLPFNRMN
jgi:hypothetical protein